VPGQRVVRRSFRGKGRKLSIWGGVSSATPTTVVSGAFADVEVLGNAGLTAIGLQGHIARTRGMLWGRSATPAEDPLVAFGIGVFDIGLTVAAQFPDPVTEPRDPYFAWGLLYCGSAVAFDVTGANMVKVDSKGKRRYNDSDRVMLVLRGVGSGHTALVYFDMDVLVIPDQGG